MSGSSHNCQSPLQYYTCESNGFKGCCSVDPCNLSGCPQDDGSVAGGSSATAVVPSSSVPSPSQPSSNPTQSAVHSDAASTIHAVSVDSNPTTLAITSTDPSEAATLLVSKSSSITSTDSASTIIITSVAFVSPENVTPTSNGVALAPTRSVVTSTAISTFSTSIFAVFSPSPATYSATTSSPTTASSPSATASTSSTSDSHSSTPAVAGSVGGVAGVVVAALFIWLLVRWQKWRRAKDTRKAQLDDDPRLQGIDANRAGSAFKDDDGIPPYGIEADARGTNQFLRDPPRSTPVSPLSPTHHANGTPTDSHLSPAHDRRCPEAEGLMTGSTNDFSELSGDAAASLSELSPHAERSAINKPRRAVVPALGHVDTAQVPRTESLMHSNLDQTELTPTGDNQAAGHKKHIMSWMDYDGVNPGPAR